MNTETERTENNVKDLEMSTDGRFHATAYAVFPGISIVYYTRRTRSGERAGKKTPATGMSLRFFIVARDAWNAASGMIFVISRQAIC